MTLPAIAILFFAFLALVVGRLLGSVSQLKRDVDALTDRLDAIESDDDDDDVYDPHGLT